MRGFEVAMCNVAIVIGLVGILIGFVGWVITETRTPTPNLRGDAEAVSVVIAAGIVLTLILATDVVCGAK
jgi:hypothetical protein